MTNVSKLMQRQADWQRQQARLPWAEKIRQAACLRHQITALRTARRGMGTR